MKKKGISAVVATILIILIVVVGVGIVWILSGRIVVGGQLFQIIMNNALVQ